MVIMEMAFCCCASRSPSRSRSRSDSRTPPSSSRSRARSHSPAFVPSRSRSRSTSGSRLRSRILGSNHIVTGWPAGPFGRIVGIGGDHLCPQSATAWYYSRSYTAWYENSQQKKAADINPVPPPLLPLQLIATDPVHRIETVRCCSKVVIRSHPICRSERLGSTTLCHCNQMASHSRQKIATAANE